MHLQQLRYLQLLERLEAEEEVQEARKRMALRKKKSQEEEAEYVRFLKRIFEDGDRHVRRGYKREKRVSSFDELQHLLYARSLYEEQKEEEEEEERRLQLLLRSFAPQVLTPKNKKKRGVDKFSEEEELEYLEFLRELNEKKDAKKKREVTERIDDESSTNKRSSGETKSKRNIGEEKIGSREVEGNWDHKREEQFFFPKF